MCGIGGIITSRSDLALDWRLRAMQTALRHRGPDDQGIAEVDVGNGLRLGLVHTRLSILDLSTAGHQPMSDPMSGSWIVYNGEVYNHLQIRQDFANVSFRSTSDTETILAGWVGLGPSVLDRLRGMFAFAVFDARRRDLWLVRDRLGVKPLYVAQVDDSTWVFASELRAILATELVSRQLNPSAIQAYLASGAVPAPWTLCEGIESLLPGECWRFRLGNEQREEDDEQRGAIGRQRPRSEKPGEGRLRPEQIQYWKPPFEASTRSRQDSKRQREEAIEAIRPVLLESVSLRMLADVPVGVFLSGGIDSSAVVGALSYQGHELQTFSVVFGEREYDESQHARMVALRFGAEHTELYLRPETILEQFDDAMAAYDQPSIDGVNTFFISQATRHAGVKVALSGLGGDELFAGYPYFHWSRRLERTVPRIAARIMMAALRIVDPHAIRTVKLDAALRCGSSRLDRYLVFREVMRASRRQQVCSKRLQDLGSPGISTQLSSIPLPDSLIHELADASQSLDPVNAHSLLELSLYLANMLLRDTDQMSMAHSLEVREPLLDHVLVETVARIPGALKLTRGVENETKSLLVDALPSRLPRQILQRPKMGFVFPWERWLRNELQTQVTDTLENKATLDAVGLDPTGVRELWSSFLDNRPGVRYTDILSLVHLLHWAKLNGMTLGEVSGFRCQVSGKRE